MINNTEVFLFFDDKWHALEVKDTVPFPLTYNIADVSDITKRNNTFSKTLEFPCTPINDAVFGYIFDIASISNFNINKKVKCTIVSETVPILKEAVLQLTKIKTTDNIHYYYECVIFGDSDNFITDMGSGLMTDIPISELNHLYSESNITNSWTASWNNGYYYPLTDLGKGYTLATIGASASGNGVPFTNMYPSPSVKYLLYKLLSYHGWSVDSDWIQNDPTFNNSYILTGQKPLPPATYSIYNTFKVGLTNSITYSPGTTLEWHYGGAGTQSILFGGNAYGFDIGMNVTSQTYLNPIPNGDNVTAFLARQGTQSTPFKFDDNFSGPNYDIGNNYSLITHKYKVGPNPNPMNFVFSLDIEFPSYIEQTMFNSEVYIKVDWYRSTYPAPNTVYIPAGPTATYAKPGEVPFMGWNAANITGAMGYIAPFQKLNVNPYPKLPPGRYTLVDGVPLGEPGSMLTFNRYAPIEGEEIWAGLTILGAARLYNGLSNPTASIGPSFSFTIHKENTFLSNNIRTELTPNVSYIGGQSMMPNNMKQVDFFTSIVKQFNLYVEQDKFIPKRLKIEPRDNYYAGGKAKNWTEKVAIDKEVSQDLIAEGQNKQILLTYKLDKDGLNTDFNTKTKNIYGQYRYTLDNEFSKGETKIESIFGSTPVANIDKMTLIVPYIYKEQDVHKPLDNFIPRFLQRANSPTNPNGVINIQDPVNYWKMEKFNTSGILIGSTTFPYYPYLGHYNDDYFPTSDLNFGEYLPYYNFPAQITADSLSNNNLFQKYYKRQLDEFTNKESRIITLYMKLTSQDINEFAFSDIIQLDEVSSGTTNYFRVNKIDYDPTLKGPFKVELLKLIYFSKPISDQGQSATERKNPIQLGIISGRDNYNTESTNIIVGNYNEILNGAQNTSIIGGNYNSIVRSDSVNLTNAFNNEIEYTNGLSLINAKGNTVSYVEDSIISGNNNIIGTSSFISSNNYIFGNNITSTQSNSFIIGSDNLIIYSGTISYGNTHSTITYVEVTYTDLTTNLIPNGLLIPGRFYKIDTEQTGVDIDAGIICIATSLNEISKYGTRYMLAPTTYDTVTLAGFDWLGVWNAALTPAATNKVVWGGQVWSNLTGAVGTSTDPFNLDATNWVLSPKTTTSIDYIQMEMSVIYDVVNNWVEFQKDELGNEIGVDTGYFTNGLINYNPCSVTDWNLKILITAAYLFNDNKCPNGIWNNITVNGIYRNICDSITNNNITGGIYRNINNSLTISDNTNVDINDNTTNGFINNNSNTGSIGNNITNGIGSNSNTGSIIGNSNIGTIVNNTNTGNINNNSNGGNISTNSGNTITNNSNKGFISLNTSGQIVLNSNLGNISTNSVSVGIISNSNLDNINGNTTVNTISYNSNIGVINGNSNQGDISFNMNNGPIQNNTSVASYDIINNINNGSISGAHVANVSDTIVNK